MAGERTEAVAGVAGPTCPWSSICSRAASSVRQNLHLIRRRGTCAPGVGGQESPGVRGKEANMLVEGRVPSPSDSIDSQVK